MIELSLRWAVFVGRVPARTLASRGKSYAFDHFIIYDTAYEGTLYEGNVMTEDSRARIPIPQRVRPYIEAWRQVCPDPSPDALMFPTKGHRKNKSSASHLGQFRAKNFFKWRVWPITDKLGIPRKLCTYRGNLQAPEEAIKGKIFRSFTPFCTTGKIEGVRKLNKKLAPQVGLEPTTLRLTAGCSAIELLRSGVQTQTKAPGITSP